jgi:hypothetical protein
MVRGVPAAQRISLIREAATSGNDLRIDDFASK